jgi:RNA polymerase sigma factor (TIGR02999 family)
MSSDRSGGLTDLLVEWGRGSRPALERLVPHVYDELCALARSYLRRERSDQTIQTGTLVHEAFLRLIDRQVAWESRAHFFGIAARLMRQVLVDHARTRRAIKRGSGEAHDPLSSALSVAVESMDVEVIALDCALEQLSALDPDQARIVELRFFGGLTVDETAGVMGTSAGTVKREWSMARAWLRRAVEGQAQP